MNLKKYLVKKSLSKEFRGDLNMWEEKLKWLCFTYWCYSIWKQGVTIRYWCWFRKSPGKATLIKLQLLPPIVYTLEEACGKWNTVWSIPVSPEIAVIHEDKVLKQSELIQLWWKPKWTDIAQEEPPIGYWKLKRGRLLLKLKDGDAVVGYNCGPGYLLEDRDSFKKTEEWFKPVRWTLTELL